jgi:dipeptidyl aminopeptidase/acylaminoacyl peptidase
MKKDRSGLRALVAVGVLVLCGAGSAHPEEAKPPAKVAPWKAEDVIFAEEAGQPRISPDAKWVVWVKSSGDKEKDARVSNLFLSSLTEDREIQLTRGTSNNFLPRWSPDGETIAFLSSKPLPAPKPELAPVQIWLISTRGGEPWPLTQLTRPPRQLRWLDKETLVFSAQEDATLYEEEAKQKKDDSEVVDDADHEAPVRLYKISVKNGKITRLTTNTDWIAAWSVSSDGKYAAAVHDKSLHYTFDQKVPPITVLHNLSDGTEKQIFNEGRVRPFFLEWALDGRGLYAVAPFSSDPKFLTATDTRLYYYDPPSGKASEVPLDWKNGLGFGFEPVRDGFIALLAAGSRFELARYAALGNGAAMTWKRTSLSGEHAQHIQGFAVTPDGSTLVYQYSTASRMPQLYRARLDGDKLASPVELTKLNEGLVNGRAFAKSEVIRWKGANDEEVEGILYYPLNYQAQRKYPVITAIHGGPTGWDMDAWDDEWAYPINLLTQRGAFVLRPNYHGSGNYGLEWAESICCGKYYDLETPDINAGVDYLIAKGMADPDKVGTLGWSNGSILSTSLITSYPDRYKVASVGAGDVEWISDWGNVDFGDSFDSYYFGKSPLEDPELYIRKSPFFKMDKVKAPVLIFHGSADRNVPPAQSWSYFRALQFHGKVPVKFVVFPGEPHGPQKLTHQLRKVNEELDWFDKYLFKSGKPANEALKEGSPLDLALRAGAVVKSEGRYGVAAKSNGKSVLIPEVVKRGDLEIGRFEVTRAQFADFDRGYAVEPGTENYPANGITFEQAKNYAAWLAKTTGQSWRLPLEKEVAAFYEKKDGENTLDYWAGYSLNPDDARLLEKKTAELAGRAPLLKPVGSFPGQGGKDEELIYDLGGNAAEWVVTSDGKGKVLGGSADQPADARASHEPSAAYIGLRVVRGRVKTD